MEDYLNERRPQWKTTSIEDNLNGRQPQWKTPQWNKSQWMTTSMEEDLKEALQEAYD